MRVSVDPPRRATCRIDSLAIILQPNMAIHPGRSITPVASVGGATPTRRAPTLRNPRHRALRNPPAAVDSEAASQRARPSHGPVRLTASMEKARSRS